VLILLLYYITFGLHRALNLSHYWCSNSQR